MYTMELGIFTIRNLQIHLQITVNIPELFMTYVPILVCIVLESHFLLLKQSSQLGLKGLLLDKSSQINISQIQNKAVCVYPSLCVYQG